MGWVFGFSDGSLLSLANKVQRALNITFELRESDMYGGDYFRYESPSEQIILQHNWDGADIAEKSFSTIPVLLRVSSEQRKEEIERFLPEARLIRSENG